MTYYAKAVQENDGYIITFRDLPNVFSEVETLETALSNAHEALNGVLAEMAKLNIDIPLPSEPLKDEHPISANTDE